MSVFVVGCGDSANTQSVSGTVTFRGQPLESGAAMFFPATGRPISATVVNGAYEAELTPGEYTVIFTVPPTIPPGFKEGDILPPPKVALPPEYSVRAKSKLTLTVTDSDPVEQNFDLK